MNAKRRSRAGILGAAPAAVLFAVLFPTLLFAQSQSAPADPWAVNLHLEIGPIEGLTTRWHPAPVSTSVPLGATLSFRVRVPAASAVHWTGAVEISRSGGYSTARISVLEPGLHTVAAGFATLSGELIAESSQLEAEDVTPASIHLGAIQVSAEPAEIDPADPQRLLCGLPPPPAAGEAGAGALQVFHASRDRRGPGRISGGNRPRVRARG